MIVGRNSRRPHRGIATGDCFLGHLFQAGQRTYRESSLSNVGAWGRPRDALPIQSRGLCNRDE